MATSETKIKLTLNAREIMTLKTVLSTFIKRNSTSDYDICTNDFKILNDINKALPDLCRAYNTDEELDN